MIDGFEYAYAEGADRTSDRTVWHISRVDAPVLLCGLPADRPVVLQPACPRNVHDVCRKVMFGPVPEPAGRVAYATCPACEGQAPVFEGRIQPHGEYRVTAEGLVQSETACVGVNMRAKQ